MDLSIIARNAEPSATLSLNSTAKAMVARGEDVAMFTVGEPDFDTPDNIKQAAIRAINAGYTNYTPASGTQELREAISDKFFQDNDIEYSPDQIIVSNGAKQALYLIMRCLLDEGDDILLPVPYWVSYAAQAEFCRARPVPIDTTSTDDLKLTPALFENALTENTKAIVVNSPCNPSGVVYSREELKQIAQVAAENDLWILTDEIYEKLIYDEAEHISIASMNNDFYSRTITFNGVSKTYAMTGWRIGYAAGPEEVITAAGRLQSNMSSGPNSIAQRATIEALRGPRSSVVDMRKAFFKRREMIVSGLNEIPGVKCAMPRGAFYAFPDCSGLMGARYAGRDVKNSVSLSQALLEEAQLAVVPGAPFGADNYLRFSYAVDRETIEKGLDRLRGFVEMRENG
ncbi:MAG: pyridoxal phosphate-dependent aminotransferase [Candidatus Brocadiia bacterium]